MDQIEEIKQKTDIVTLVQARIKLTKSGRNFKSVCPFHSERTPSFMVSPELQIYKCFGCGKGGDVYGFLKEYEGMDFPEALKYLADRAGIKLERFQADKQYERKERLREIMHLASEYFHFLLIEHRSGKVALRYLLERNISQKAVKYFHLGYAPNSWDALIRYLAGKKKYQLDDLESVGLVIRKGKKIYDRFRQRIIFPLRDVQGNVVGFAGRVLPGADEEKAKYINSPETELYHKSHELYGMHENRKAIRNEDQVVLVEGELDMISSWQAGVKNVVAVKGTALTTEQIELIRRYTRRIVLALDADRAGEAATKRSIGLADDASLFVSVVLVKGGKDPDEIARKNPTSWIKSVKSAVSVYDYYLEVVSGKYDISNGVGKKQASEEFIPILAKISNSVEQAHYISAFSNLLHVSEESVIDELRRYERTASIKGSGEKVDALDDNGSEPSRVEILDFYLLSLMLQGGKITIKSVPRELANEIATTGVRRIIKQILSIKNKAYKANEFIESLPKELQAMAQQAYLRDLGFSGKEDFVREINKVLYELQVVSLRSEMNKVGKEISNLEKKEVLSQNEKRQLHDLEQRFSDLSKKLKE
jgi:DNA primase